MIRYLVVSGLALLFSGCILSDMQAAKTQAWAEKACIPHLGVHTITYRIISPTAYCRDGSTFTHKDIRNYIDSAVAEYLKEKE